MDSRFNRRQILALALAGPGVGLTGCIGRVAQTDQSGGTATTAGAGDESTTAGGDESAAAVPEAVGLETLATGFRAPLDVAFAPDADRRYVADQPGVVSVHESGGLRDDPFLDLRDVVETGSEKGLLGIALHPEFAENRRVFVRYSAPPRSGTPDDYSHTFVLAEFEASRDGLRARRDTERTVLEIPQPQPNHNAGSVVFGPDGHLYVGVGDGGGGGDQGTGHVDDWYDGVSGGNGQDVTENLLGSILRIDVDEREGGKGYGVPEDNPLVGTDGLDEHYAWGLRNPWRMSFDAPEGDGGTASGGEWDFYVADVGQSAYEEVNLVEAGGNYGWNVREATHCYGASSCPARTPDGVRGGEPLVDPVIEYPHSGGDVSGVSVIGGYVYRGSAIPGLDGRYVFADLDTRGRLFVATRPDGDGLWPIRTVDVAGGLDRVLSFGRDADGELYVLGSTGGQSGLHRVVPA
jgi:glucose/arabinose dehydrogenase